MHKPEFVLENETHKILWDFEIRMDNLISARRPVLHFRQKTSPTVNKQEKRIYCQLDFVILADHKVKIKESKKIDKYLDFARELKIKCDT